MTGRTASFWSPKYALERFGGVERRAQSPQRCLTHRCRKGEGVAMCSDASLGCRNLDAQSKFNFFLVKWRPHRIWMGGLQHCLLGRRRRGRLERAREEEWGKKTKKESTLRRTRGIEDVCQKCGGGAEAVLYVKRRDSQPKQIKKRDDVDSREAVTDGFSRECV